jgi:hypothetical protein
MASPVARPSPPDDGSRLWSDDERSRPPVSSAWQKEPPSLRSPLMISELEPTSKGLHASALISPGAAGGAGGCDGGVGCVGVFCAVV